MARRVPPTVPAFVSGSTPVISFGDPRVAEVATIGINPSRREFDNGGWLRGSQRRLATLESVNATSGCPLTPDQARQVIGDCNAYFSADRNPYWAWFRPLERVLNNALGVSYLSGTACHLDLVQWATDPVWSRLTNKADRLELMAEGRPHLATLMSQSQATIIVCAGRTVVDQMRLMGLLPKDRISVIPVSQTTCSLYFRRSGGITYIGWSSNLQSGRGISNEFKARLCIEVKRLIKEGQA